MSILIDGFENRAKETELRKTIFGDLETAELSPVFQGTFEYTVDNTELNENIIVGNGTITQADAMAVLSTSTTPNSSACLRSRRVGRYTSGLGATGRFTALFETFATDTEQYIGLLGEFGINQAFKNGLAIGFDGAVFGFHRFVNDTKITIPLSDWDDTLNGLGASGMNIINSFLNVWDISYQYLGAGAISVSVENPETGLFFSAENIKYANKNIVPSSYNPNYHITYFLRNNSNPVNLTLKSASYSYFIQGKTSPIKTHQPNFSTGLISKSNITTETVIFSIRSKAQYFGKRNFIEILLQSIGVSVEASSANNLAEIMVIKNAVITGAVWSDINSTNSTVEISTTGAITGGRELFDIPLAGKDASSRISRIDFGNEILLHDETITIIGKSANNATINASGLWKELF